MDFLRGATCIYLVPSQNIEYVLSGKFKAIGRLFGHSFFHGGVSAYFCEPVLEVMIGTPIPQVVVTLFRLTKESHPCFIQCN